MARYRLWLALAVVFLLASGAQAQRPVERDLHSAESGATANGTALTTTGFTAVTVQVETAGGWDGTLTFEGENDDVPNFHAIQCRQQSDSSLASTATSSDVYICPVNGLDTFRARISGRTSGNVTVTAQLSGPGSYAGVMAASVSGSTGNDEAKQDDSAFTVDSDEVFPTGYLADDAAPDSVDEGDIGAPRMSLNRVPYSILRDAAGNERGVNVNASNELATEAFQLTHDNLNLNANLQIGDTDAPGGAGAVTASTQRTTLASDDPAVVSLAAIDDWEDTTDRVGADIIAGQAGIAGGTGVDGANVPRFSLATDIPLPAGTNNIGDVDVLSFPDNEPFDLAQVAGTTTSVNSGAADAGTQRVVEASDSPGNTAATADTESTGVSADATLEPATANLRLMAVVVTEQGGSVVAEYHIRHGVVTTGNCTGNVFPVNEKLGIDQSVSTWFGPQGLDASSGVCIDVIAGTVDVNIATVTE